jgi:hypothetical protein
MAQRSGRMWKRDVLMSQSALENYVLISQSPLDDKALLLLDAFLGVIERRAFGLSLASRPTPRWAIYAMLPCNHSCPFQLETGNSLAGLRENTNTFR